MSPPAQLIAPHVEEGLEHERAIVQPVWLWKRRDRYPQRMAASVNLGRETRQCYPKQTSPPVGIIATNGTVKPLLQGAKLLNKHVSNLFRVGSSRSRPGRRGRRAALAPFWDGRGTDPVPTDDAPVLVIGKDNDRYPFAREPIDQLRAEREAVLVVAMGWPSDGRAYADLATFGVSRLSAAPLFNGLTTTNS